MIQDALDFWKSIQGKVRQAVTSMMTKAMQCERYDVTTAPNGTVIGVTKPLGGDEIFLKYSNEVANAVVGDTVLVVWWGSLSNARVWCYGSGLKMDDTTKLPLAGGTVTGNLNVTGNFSVNGNAIGRVLGLGQARAEIPSNADLNDYIEPGVYGVTTDSIAASLANCPAAHAGTLRVWHGIGGASNPGESWYYVVQEYNDFYGDSWRRSGQSGSGTTVTWGAWFASLNSSDKRLGSGTDLDNYKTTGFYGITSGAANAPQNWTWLMVIGAAGGVVQVVFAQSKIMIRAYTGYPLAWTAWKSVSLS